MTLDIARIRKDFPILERQVRGGQPLVYLDSANTSQKPRQVIDTLTEFYERHNANIHRASHQLGEEATAAYEGARIKVAQFIGMMAVAIGGVDALVFTGGIGEHAEGVRRSTLQHLAFLKPLETLVIPANEEGIMARHAFLLMQNTVKERKAS